MRQVLQPFIVREDAEARFVRIECEDGGGADVYLDDDAMMATEISGITPWSVLVEGARAADWVILPLGARTCVTDDSQRAHLPARLGLDVVLVITGAELLRTLGYPS